MTMQKQLSPVPFGFYVLAVLATAVITVIIIRAHQLELRMEQEDVVTEAQ